MKKNSENIPNSSSNVDEQIFEMWRDFDLTQRIIDLKQIDNVDIHRHSDFAAVKKARASGTLWSPVITGTAYKNL